MPLIEQFAYVFRGTTIGYPGNKNSIEMPYTCTSIHPIKALWFALECYHRNPEQAVVYIAEIKKLDGIPRGVNHLHNLEDEIGFFIQPLDFYTHCEGCLHVSDFQKVIQEFGIDGYNVVRKDNLTRLCRETLPLDFKGVERMVKELTPYLKK